MPAPIVMTTLSLFGWLVLAAPAGADELTSKQCEAARAANALISCDHCLTLKDLMTSAADGAIEVSVHDLQSGALVEISGATPEVVQSIHTLADRLWATSSELVEQAKYCGGCEERQHRLVNAIRDRALTDKGVIVVLTAEDPELVTWLREEARSQGELVRRASGE